MRSHIVLVAAVGVVIGLLCPWAIGGAVDRLIAPVSFATTQGPPSAVVDGQGNLHVIYSRGDDAWDKETRADLYYRKLTVQVDAQNTPTGISTGPEICLTHHLGSFQGVSSTSTDSFHMTPRLAIDTNDRVHVIFSGYGRLRDGRNTDFLPTYVTKLGYLTFDTGDISADVDGNVYPAKVHASVILESARDSDLNEPTLGTDKFNYSRYIPNIAVRDLASGATEVHATCCSASSEWSTGNLGCNLTYVRFSFSSGTVSGLKKLNLAKSFSDSQLIDDQPYGAVFPVGEGLAQVIGEINVGPTRSASTWELRHYLVDADNAQVSATKLLGQPSFFGIGADQLVANQVRLGGHNSNGAELVLRMTQSGSSWSLSQSQNSGSFLSSFTHYGLGDAGLCIGSHLYALTGRLSFLADAYLIDVENPPGGRSFDLVARSRGTAQPTDLIAVYSDTGQNSAYWLLNTNTTGQTGNLHVTVFREPDPDNDLVSWISAPQDGDKVYLHKKDKGKVTLVGVDGAPGNDETYNWYEGLTYLGSGQSLTHSFTDGEHTVTLELTKSGSASDPDDTVSFTVITGKPPAEPSPGITVSPTSGLETTEAEGTATFTVVLDTQTTGNVTIAISSSDISEGTVSPCSLTFTTSNWDTAQTVTITGVDDDTEDGDVDYTIVLAQASSSDADYDGLDPIDVSVTNKDDDGATPKTYSSTDVTKSIPDEGQVTSTLTVSDTGTIASLGITLQITHDRPFDLTVVLISPANTRETIDGPSGTFTTTKFADENLDGVWKLEITDGKKRKTGTLDSWSITVTVK